MISFDQVLLLEERVESAVKKIEQLNAENAALRAKVAELSNALNAKSEQFSSFQSDQSKIEEGILKALSRLNAVENVVLQASGAAQSVSVAASVDYPAPQLQAESVQEQAIQSPIEQSVERNFATQSENPAPAQNPEPTFDTMKPSSENIERSTVSAPEVDFEYGDSDKLSETSAQETQMRQPVDEGTASSQPMFDIF